MKIKICGIRRIEDVLYLNEFKPDFAGFVFAPSKRIVTFEEAKKLREALDKDIKTVGVFVNGEVEFVRRLAEEKIIDIIQLHGDEDDEYISKLRAKVPVVKAQRVKTRDDIKEYDCDMYLFDTLVSGAYGGTGKSFDWSILNGVKKPYFLAGGINEENIDAACRSGAYAIDVSGGVETNGFKDREKIRKIIERVRLYE
jgi:phosphoribosylanthranilate isomerase